jgi:hypothetical protein
MGGYLSIENVREAEEEEAKWYTFRHAQWDPTARHSLKTMRPEWYVEWQHLVAAGHLRLMERTTAGPALAGADHVPALLAVPRDYTATAATATHIAGNRCGTEGSSRKNEQTKRHGEKPATVGAAASAAATEPRGRCGSVQFVMWR